MMATGHIKSLEEGRAVIAQSFELKTFNPEDRRPWDEAYARLLKLL
jgi:rhamnulokinase